MNQSRFCPKLIVGIILALFFGVALCLRIVPPYDQVFVGDWIKFTGVDAYYHMRLVDNLVHHFPHHIGFDPYTFYPYSQGVGWYPFFDWLLAGIIWVIGLGSPTQHTIDVVGVYFPAVLGALAVIPVYFIGKELFNRWVGVISAGLIALLPGEFLGRSILGFTDHHVAETLFSTITILFLVLAIKSARQRQLSFSHIKHRDWATSTKPLLYSLLAGLFLAVYILSWIGGLFLVFIIFIYFIIQFIIDHLRGQATDYLGIVGVISLLVASVITLSLMPQTWATHTYQVSLPVAIVTPLILNGISRLMASKGIKLVYYPLTLIGLGLAGLGVFYVVDPGLLKLILGGGGLGWFTWKPEISHLEAQPLLLPMGNFTLRVAWGNFTTGFFISFISLGILIYSVIKQSSADKTLLVVWSLVMLTAALGERRFAYYFAVNVALLTGYLSWRILGLAGFKEPAVKPIEIPRKIGKKAKPEKSQKGGFHIATRHINMALGIIVVFFLAFFPNIGPAMATAKATPFAPDDAWCESLSWMRENTPEPFGNPDFYYELHQTPHQYPESAYGVMAWWDYGHWITRIARRPPNATPFSVGITEAAQFFSSQEETSANKIMDKLDSRYVVIDHATATSKFYAIASYADRNPEEFYDVYYQLQEGKVVPIPLFYPEYYHSLSTRLYNFDGKAVIPESSVVISHQERISREGKLYKQITSSKSFTSYEAATAYILSQKSGNYKIVSDNPFVSPVPLKRLENYKLIYSSDDSIMQPGAGMISLVKIFEYLSPQR